MSSPFTGLIPAVHTPMRSDLSVNFDAIEQQAEHLHGAGVAAVFVCGSSGECHSLTVDERLQIAKRWVDVVSGTELRVMVQVGHHAVTDAMLLAAHAQEIGADAISAVAPSYFKPQSVTDVVDYCEMVASRAPDLPFFYYDIPPLTGIQFPTHEVMNEAARRIPNLAGVKYSNPNLLPLQECQTFRESELEILFGCDEILLAGLSLGVKGAVGTTYNFAVPLYHRLIAAFERGDLDAARREQVRSTRMIRTLYGYQFLPASKVLMTMLGVDCGPARPPLRNLSADQQISLLRDLEALEIFDTPLRLPSSVMA